MVILCIHVVRSGFSFLPTTNWLHKTNHQCRPLAAVSDHKSTFHQHSLYCYCQQFTEIYMHRTVICKAMRLFMFTRLAPPLILGTNAHHRNNRYRFGKSLGTRVQYPAQAVRDRIKCRLSCLPEAAGLPPAGPAWLPHKHWRLFFLAALKIRSLDRVTN